MKECPFCSEKIQDDAKKCRYCAEWLDSRPSGNPLDPNAAPRYAGFWVRLAAAIIDGAIIALLVLFVASPVAITLTVAGISEDGLSAVIKVLGFIVFSLYFVWFTFKNNATPGKTTFGIRVVSADGKAPDLTRVLRREIVGKFVSNIAFLIGYLIAGLTANKQALHDKIAGTVVAYATRPGKRDSKHIRTI